MNLTKKSLNSWFTRIVFLAIVICTVVNCNCGSKNNTLRKNDKDDENNSQEETNHKLNIELTAASDEVVDSDIIEFQLINKDTEEINLERIITNLEITEKKDFDRQQTNKGSFALISPNNNININFGGGIKGMSVAEFTEEKKLIPGKKVSIFVRIVNLEGLGSALVNCQLKDAANQYIEIAKKTVTFKLTKPIGPIEDKNLEIKVKDVKFTDNTKKLSFGITLKNIGGHPISLEFLKFDFVFNGVIEGKTENIAQQLFKQNNSILESGKEREIQLMPVKITDVAMIESLRNAIGTNDLLAITPQVSTQEGKILYDVKQLVKLSSPDLPEIGPKQGSKIEHTLDTQKIVFNNGELTLPLLFRNNSDHAIDLEKLEHEVNIYQDRNKLISTKLTGDNLNWGEHIIKKEDTKTFNLALKKDLTDNILANNHTATHTLEFITKSIKDGQIVGEMKQPFKIKVGPIPGESTTEISILDKIDLVYNTDENKYKAKFTIKITNTSDHIINLKRSIYDYSIFTTAEGQIYNESFKGEEGLNNIFLKKDQNHTLALSVSLGNMSKEAAENFLSTNEFFFEFIMKTLDGNYVVGTNKQEVRFGK